MAIDIGTDPPNAPTTAQLAQAADAMATVRVTGFSRAKARLQFGQPVTILIDSDSTGFSSSRWPTLFATWLASEYPASAVTLYAWDAAAFAYDAGTVISAGSGGPAITIYNFAVSGASITYGLGNYRLRALAAVSPDCIVINHGLNHAVGTVQAMSQGELLAGIGTLRAMHPRAGIVGIIQNPFSDNTNMDAVKLAWETIGHMTDVSLVTGIFEAFTAAGKIASWYNGDNTHPSDAIGSPLYAAKIEAHWQITVPVMASVDRSFLLEKIPDDMNLLGNGSFAKWTTSPGVPDGWSAGGTGTLTAAKETTIVADGRKGWSVKLTATGNATWIEQALGSGVYTYLRGKKVTLAARRYIDASINANTCGRMFVQAGSPALGTQTVTTRSYNTQQTGWVWWAISGFDVPADANSLKVGLYHDSAASPDTDPTYWDQAVLVPGSLPRCVM